MTAPEQREGPAASPPRSGWYRTDIQGLRAVAVLLVVAFHAGVGPQAGFVGVDVFFVISGYVVGAQLLRELQASGSVRPVAFWERRARRLMPAMAVFTVVTAVASLLLLNPNGPLQRALGTGAAATVWVANVQLYRTTGYFDGSAELNPFLHTWSLSVEEQFYVVLPVGLLAVWWIVRRRPPRQREATLGVAVVTVALGSLMLAQWLLRADSTIEGASLFEAPQRLAFFAMPTRLWQFAAGVLVALAWRRLRSLGPVAAAVAGVCGLVGILVTAVKLDPAAPHPSAWALVVTGCTALVLAAGGRTSPVDLALSLRPLRWLGDRSYGWYLWHWPFVVFASLLWSSAPWVPLLAATAALLPAAASYRFLERPIRTTPMWNRRRSVALVAACVGAPLVVLSVLVLAADTGLGVQEPLDWYEGQMQLGTRCHAINADAPVITPDSSCHQGADGEGPTVLLLGDEHARGVESAVVDATASLGGSVVSWTRSGCPVLAGVAPVHSPGCLRWQATVDEVVEELEPDVVVLAHQGPRYVAAGRSRLDLAGADGRRVDDAEQATRLWAEGLAATLDGFERLDIPVVVVRPTVDFGPQFPRARRSMLDPEPDLPVMSRSEVEADRSDILAVELEPLDRVGVRTVDPVPFLCGEQCEPVRDGRWLQRSAIELTPFGAAGLEPAFRSALGALLR